MFGSDLIKIQLNSPSASPTQIYSPLLKFLINNKKQFISKPCLLKTYLLDTPLGPMIAISDDKVLYLLEFLDRKNLRSKIEKLSKTMQSNIHECLSDPIISIKKELQNYFSSKLEIFNTPLQAIGTPFQNLAWQAITKIPYGNTISYTDQAIELGNKSLCRAAANANGANPLCIIIPCHRIINKNDKLGGYSSGIERKMWLIEHEIKHIN